MALRRIVAVSKQADVQELARRIGHELFVADNLDEGVDIIGTAKPDLVILDVQVGGNHIREFFDRTDKNSVNVPIVVIGSGQDEDSLSAEEFIQMGAVDYLQNRQDYDRLQQIVNRIKTQIVDRIKNNFAAGIPDEEREDFFAEDYAAAVSMVGRSKAIVDALKMIKLVATSRCNPVLILGETGTGKELAAKAIHTLRHPDEQFVAVNCSALTANLLESELFGHVKGAFTSADRDKTGLLELAGSGTIFLDEISEMPMDLQAKLLRVLQEKTFRKVGGIKNITCNATIIASSNRNLKRQIRANHFRRDLYYRLNICPITMAPLKAPERREDIPLLAEYFLRTSTVCPEKNPRITSLTKLAMEALERHDWPGNVRELRNVIERAILLETTDKIGLSGLIIDPPEFGEESESKADYIKDFSLAKAERKMIARALQETGWQKTRAAALLGITRATLYAKVKQHNIEKDTCVAEEPQTQNDSPPKESQSETSMPFSPEPVMVS